jgi:hypothetical protein
MMLDASARLGEGNKRQQGNLARTLIGEQSKAKSPNAVRLAQSAEPNVESRDATEAEPVPVARIRAGATSKKSDTDDSESGPGSPRPSRAGNQGN